MFQKSKNVYHLAQALLASIFFGFPSRKLTVIGVTGTDGKTTTVHMIYEILRQAGKKVSMVSSVRAIIGSKKYDTGFHVTTPSPWQIQKYLKKAVDAGSNYFVQEATSHGLDQNRLAFIDFDVAVITNVTDEHLDYHKTFENYLKAKAKLFKSSQFSILNADDGSLSYLKKESTGKVITYGFNKKADFNPDKFPLKLTIRGQYNLANAQAAAAAASSLNIHKKSTITALSKFKGIEGRMQKIEIGQDFKAIVDFAHTPNALSQALKTLHLELTANGSHLIAVFGAAGERDKNKRKKMGKIAARHADISVLTAEDPRRENVQDISDQIAEGLTKFGKKLGKDFYCINDRRQAIAFAINLAKKGDTVAFFGKGHEKSMCFGKKEYHWDEVKIVENSIKRRLYAS